MRVIGRKRRRAHEAGIQAMAEFNQAEEAAHSRTQIDVYITVTCWREGGVIWNVWDSRPAFTDQIEGVLVPYAHGQASSREEAEAAARDSVGKEARCRLVKVVIEEMEDQ